MDSPAFPQLSIVAADGIMVAQSVPGMTLRDYFAARAMANLVNGNAAQNICDRDPRYTGNNFAQVVSLCAYEFADAMLIERLKVTP